MPLKLLHAIQTMNPATGGPVEGMRQLAAVNAQFGHIIEAVTLDPVDAPWVHTGGIKVHALGTGFTSIGFSMAYLRWLQENARLYDCIIVNGVWGFNAFGTWLALARMRASGKYKTPPYIVFPHGMLDPWFKYRYPLKHLKKWLYYPWGLFPVLRDAAGVFFTCDKERLLARESFWLYDCMENVVHYGTAGIPNPNSDYTNSFLEAHPELKGKRRFLFFGRVHPKKGPDVLIRAIARLQGAGSWNPSAMRLVMAGPADSTYAAK
jgi:glycosyltransferase involved in cell wall biosynthesis